MEEGVREDLDRLTRQYHAELRGGEGGYASYDTVIGGGAGAKSRLRPRFVYQVDPPNAPSV